MSVVLVRAVSLAVRSCLATIGKCTQQSRPPGCGPTGRSSGRSKACCARLSPPLISNVRSPQYKLGRNRRCSEFVAPRSRSRPVRVVRSCAMGESALLVAVHARIALPGRPSVGGRLIRLLPREFKASVIAGCPSFGGPLTRREFAKVRTPKNQRTKERQQQTVALAQSGEAHAHSSS